jgi:hypothetical protein
LLENRERKALAVLAQIRNHSQERNLKFPLNGFESAYTIIPNIDI